MNPQPLPLTSGDLLADRRFAYAQSLRAKGDREGEASLIVQALELAPGWAAGWFALGEAREAAGNGGGAREAFAHAVTLAPADLFGAGLRAARLTGETPSELPPAYVRALFDEYADRFEGALLERLDYRAPALLRMAVAGHLTKPNPEGRRSWLGSASFGMPPSAAPQDEGGWVWGINNLPHGEERGRRVSNHAQPGSKRHRDLCSCLDLGCGTGLAGRAFADLATRLVGVDLSAGMLAQAGPKDLYDALHEADVVAFLQTCPERFDLVVAADVLVYLGELRPALAGAARVLVPGGLLAFTVERSDGEDFALGPTLRYRHSQAYVKAALRDARLALETLEEADLRLEKGEPVPGLVVVARAP